MANIRVKDLPNTSAPAADTDEFIIDSSSAGTRRLNYGELKTAISGDFQAGTSTYKVATLGSDNKLDPAQIPDTLSQGLNFVGVANSAGDLTSTTQGDFYVIQTAFGVYSVGDQAVYDGSAYIRVTDGTKEISEGGTGATTLDDAKGNLEIPDVGLSPNQVPLVGQLGSMAFQSSEGISVGTATIDGDAEIGATSTDHTRLTISSPNNKDGQISFDDTDGSLRGFVVYDHAQEKLKIGSGGANAVYVDSSQRVGIGTVSPPQRLTVQGGGVQIAGAISSPASGVSALLLDWVNSNSRYWSRGVDATTQGTHNFYVLENDGGNQVNALEINASGLKLPVSGTGIDFSATGGGGGTVTSSLLDDYEAGSFVPVIADATSGGNVGSAATATGEYTKVGRVVHFSLRILTVDKTGMTAGNTFYIRNLPFVQTSSGNTGQLAVKTDDVTFNTSITGSVVGGQSNAYLVSLRTGLSDLNITVADIATGADILLSGSYVAA